MKKFNILVLSLIVTLTFILSEIYVCEAQIETIAKGVGFGLKMAWKARKHLKEKEKPDPHVVQNKKLNQITKKIQSLEKEMVVRFRNLLNKIENVPNATIHGHIASQFESDMIGVQKKLDDLIYKKEKINRGELLLDYHVRDDIDNLKTKIEEYKDDLEIIMSGKNLSHDFLSQVKNLADVCKDRMSQVQLLDSFGALHIDTMSRYLIGGHIVISLWEKADNNTQNDKKKYLNGEVKRYLETYGNIFQKLMAKSSREYQGCTEPKNPYSIQKLARDRSPKCFTVGGGSFSNEIVKFDEYRRHRYCDDYVSLRAAKARPGYVVVGAKIEHHENIVYIKIIEGKMLPNGMIDPNTINYSEDSKPGIGDKVFYLRKPTSMFDLTAAVSSDDRVVTGLSFAVTADKHVYLDVITQKLNVNDGVLIDNTTRSETHPKATTKFQVIRNIRQRYNKTIRNANGLQPVKPHQYVTLWPGPSKNYKEIVFWPVFDTSDIFPTPLTLLSGAGLYVNQIKATQGYLSIRLFTFNIAPHVSVIDFNIDDDFADALKDI